MEAEERPTKQRKLSHDVSLSEIPDSVDTKEESPAQTPTRPALSTTQNPSASNSDSSSNILEIKEPVSPAEQQRGGSTVPDISEHLPTELSTTPGLSKNQLKKQKRKAEWEAGRENRKALRREKEKAKKARRKAAREEAHAKAEENGNNERNEQNNGGGKDLNASAWVPRKTYRFKQRTRVRVPIAVVLDCSFDKLMTEKEIISLGSQLTRCYSDNSKAPYSSHFYISSWAPESELRKRFEVLMRGTYKNWKGIEFTENDFVEAGRLAHVAMTGPKGGKMAGVFEKYIQNDDSTSKSEPSTNQNGHSTQTENGEITTPTLPSTTELSNSLTPSLPMSISVPDHPRLIYLTSDSPHTLWTLSPHTTYIIGGLVDKNRHKSLCFNTAVRLGIPTAKLPLAQYMKMTSREVLATNHVLEIMLRWLEVGDWGEAFLGVLPKRKGAVLRGREGEGNNRDGEDEEQFEDDGGASGRSDVDEYGDGGDIDDVNDNDDDSVDAEAI